MHQRLVRVKLQAMTTPNGLAGCWFVLGFTASTRKPTGFINDPVIIDRTMTSGSSRIVYWVQWDDS
jgi:hypothetical protein